jgi:hypothetical protein
VHRLQNGDPWRLSEELPSTIDKGHSMAPMDKHLLADVRYGMHCGPISDIAPLRGWADSGHSAIHSITSSAGMDDYTSSSAPKPFISGSCWLR